MVTAGKRYEELFRQSFQGEKVGTSILELVIEKFKKESMPDGSVKSIAVKTVNFITFMIYDLPRLYFDNIGGRKNPLLEYQTSTEERKRDADIVRAHTRFINACCHCLFLSGSPEYNAKFIDVEEEKLDGEQI